MEEQKSFSNNLLLYNDIHSPRMRYRCCSLSCTSVLTDCSDNKTREYWLWKMNKLYNQISFGTCRHNLESQECHRNDIHSTWAEMKRIRKYLEILKIKLIQLYLLIVYYNYGHISDWFQTWFNKNECSYFT